MTLQRCAECFTNLMVCVNGRLYITPNVVFTKRKWRHSYQKNDAKVNTSMSNVPTNCRMSVHTFRLSCCLYQQWNYCFGFCQLCNRVILFRRRKFTVYLFVLRFYEQCNGLHFGNTSMDFFLQSVWKWDVIECMNGHWRDWVQVSCKTFSCACQEMKWRVTLWWRMTL